MKLSLDEKGAKPSKDKEVDIGKYKSNKLTDDDYYTPTQKIMVDEARAAGEVILVNGKQPMTEERWQAEQMKDV